MILTCPSCGTQYAVKDGAIAAGGRKVRCAACGHSWHQDPDTGSTETEAPSASAPEPPPAAGPIEPDEPAPADGEAAELDAGPAEPRQAYEEIEPIAPGAPLVEPPAAVPVPPPDDAFVDQREPSEEQWDLTKELPDAEEIEALRTETGADRKRNWLMAILIAMGLVAAVALAFWFLAPDSLRQQIGMAAASPTPLQIAPGVPERQKLASGNELVVVTGRVINPSSKHQQVPPIEAQLRDKSGRLLYAWTIAPPARSLPPGGSATFNSAEMNVPSSGLDSTVTLTLKS
jgi:predicted Zn finger-like uncharacterized protein